MADLLPIRPFDPKMDKPRQNPDGTHSTEILRTVQTEKGWMNVPSLWWNKQTGEPVDLGQLPDDSLAMLAKRSGRRFPMFKSLTAAEKAAQKRSAAGGAVNGSIDAPRSFIAGGRG